MVKDYKRYLTYILGDIKEAELFVSGFTLEKFEKSSLVQNAIFKKLENIGEGVKHLPEDIKDLKPEIPWQKITSSRNFIIHEYFGINLKSVWNTVKEDLPPLKKAVEELLKK
jgi:uncharacterized protein with HEPN domain